MEGLASPALVPHTEAIPPQPCDLCGCEPVTVTLNIPDARSRFHFC